MLTVDDLKANEVNDLILEHSPDRAHAKENRNLFLGKLPIYTDKKHDGRNRIGTMFHRKMVNEFTGFSAGKPPTIQHTTSDEIQGHFDRIAFDADLSYLQRQMMTEAAIAGAVYLMPYQTEDGETKLIIQPRENIKLIRDELTNEVKLGIRYYYLLDGHTPVLHAELYDTEGSIRYFIQSHGSLVEDFSTDKPTTHSFRGIPIIEYAFNRHKISLIDAIKDQAIAYDSILSFAADENEGIAHTIATLEGAEGIDQGEFEKMLRSRMIELPVGGSFQFVSKDAKTEPMEKFLDRMERLMYDTAQVVNMSDKDFTAAQSGVAIMLKTFGMSNLAKTVQDEFRRGYKDLLKCIEPIIAAKMGAMMTTEKTRKPVYTLDEWDIQFDVNIPLPMTENIDKLSILKSMDIVDDETILSLMNFVSDPLAILEKKEIQDREKMGLDYLDLHEEE